MQSPRECLSTTQRELWRYGASLASIPIELVEADALAAIAALAQGGVDICIVDGELPHDDRNAVIKAGRAAPSGPLVVLAAPPGASRMDDVDGVLTKPGSNDEVRKQVELCVRAKIPTRVLIVDDSCTMRSIVRKILAASRFALDIHEALEGGDAIAQLRNGRFGIVFLDYNMPGFNSFATLAEIKRAAPNVAVVMMTSTLDNIAAERAQSSGALAFLKKPFYPGDVDAVLEHHYRLHVPAG